MRAPRDPELMIMHIAAQIAGGLSAAPDTGGVLWSDVVDAAEGIYAEVIKRGDAGAYGEPVDQPA